MRKIDVYFDKYMNCIYLSKMKINHTDLQPGKKYIIQNHNQTKIGEFINRYDKYLCVYFKILRDNDYYYAYENYNCIFYEFFESLGIKRDESHEKTCNMLDFRDFLSLFSFQIQNQG
jgi:hypothetical protein